MDLNDCKRVIVRAPNWLGDLVMANPIFARIRQALPEAHITCGMRPNLRRLLLDSPHFDDFLEMPQGERRFGDFRAQVRAVRAGRYDLAIVLPNSPSTGWIMRLAGVPRRVGYKQGRPWTITHGLTATKNRGWFGDGPRRVPEPMPEYWGKLLDHIGMPPLAEVPALAVRDADRAWVDAFLAEEGYDPAAPLALFNPGANYGPSKLWLPERWSELATHFKSAGMQTMFLAGPNETDLVAPMAAAADCKWSCLPLDKLPALIATAKLVVSTDTGPRHLAVASKVPTVCLMGPNDSRYTDFALHRQVVLQKKELECVPCQRKVCPLGHHDCMQQITVAEVIASADGLLRQLSAS